MKIGLYIQTGRGQEEGLVPLLWKDKQTKGRIRGFGRFLKFAEFVNLLDLKACLSSHIKYLLKQTVFAFAS